MRQLSKSHTARKLTKRQSYLNKLWKTFTALNKKRNSLVEQNNTLIKRHDQNSKAQLDLLGKHIDIIEKQIYAFPKRYLNKSGEGYDVLRRELDATALQIQHENRAHGSYLRDKIYHFIRALIKLQRSFSFQNTIKSGFQKIEPCKDFIPKP